LEKHLLAHKMGRCVQPKVITNADGSTSMALPTDAASSGEAATEQQHQISAVFGSGDRIGQQLIAIHPTTTTSTSSSTSVEAANAGGDQDDGQQATISLSMDDLMQYAQPVPDNVIHDDQNNGLEDKLAEGATKFVPLNMDEFIVNAHQHEQAQHNKQNEHHHHHEVITGDLHANDSGEFPDLLDSESNLESLSSVNLVTATRSKPDALHEDHESGLTFATLSGVKPEYPDGVQRKDNVVVARKSSAAPLIPKSEAVGNNAGGNNEVAGGGQVRTEDIVHVLANEAISQLSKAQIKLPAGTCLVPSDAKYEQSSANFHPDQAQLEMIGNALQNSNLAELNLQSGGGQSGSSNPMTITIQYKIYQDAQGEPQKFAVQRDLADIINEAPPDPNGAGGRQNIGDNNSMTSTPSTPTPPLLTSAKSTAKVKTIGVDMDPSEAPPIPFTPNHGAGPDPAKETRKVLSASGKEFEIPVIVKSGFDLDKLLCTLCDRTFKNDKTLMGHMLNHFGVTPKMASCPICGLTLQKKSYARHLRLHGNVVPEICPYCQKEFREKRSMDKHIKAIHQAERPYSCNYCSETFRNAVEQKNHINRHVKDYPHECDVCHMTFQKQDSLTTHYR
jgi:hypothetical protein